MQSQHQHIHNLNTFGIFIYPGIADAKAGVASQPAYYLLQCWPKGSGNQVTVLPL